MRDTSTLASSTQTDTQVTTIVQQLDAQGPAVIERISTQFADVACTPENARQLVEALHSGSSVTLSADGKTASFTPTTHLGYGDAYIALALAAEALRNAGVTGCATPEQWKAVLLGGPLSAAGTTVSSTTTSASASSSSEFPGILKLHSEGQGWGQVAQTTHVQLGQVVSSAHSSFKLGRDGQSSLSPTGRSSDDTSKTPTGDITPSASSSSSSSADKAHDHDSAKDQDSSPGASDKSSSSDASTSSSPASSSSSSSSTTPGSSR